MKKLILSLIALAGFTVAAQDNYWAPGMLFSSESLTGKVLTNGTSSAYCTNTFSCVGKELGLQLNLKAAGSCTSNTTVTVYKSLDGLNWTPLTAFNLAATSTTAVTLTTNATVNSVKMIKVEVSTAAIFGTGITNCTLWATSK